MIRENENMLKLKELAVKLNVHPNTVYRLVEAGMPCARLGSLMRFDYDKVIKWMEEDKK